LKVGVIKHNVRLFIRSLAGGSSIFQDGLLDDGVAEKLS